MKNYHLHHLFLHLLLPPFSFSFTGSFSLSSSSLRFSTSRFRTLFARRLALRDRCGGPAEGAARAATGAGTVVGAPRARTRARSFYQIR